MKLHIQNIAKIHEADLEINGITVLAGENSTGKSTVSKVLYCVYETFFDIENKIINEKCASIRTILNTQIDEKSLLNDDSYSPHHKIDILSNMTNDIINKTNNLSVDECTKVINDILINGEYKFIDHQEVISRIVRINSLPKKQVITALFNRYISREFNNQFTPLSHKGKNKDALIDLS